MSHLAVQVQDRGRTRRGRRAHDGGVVYHLFIFLFIGIGNPFNSPTTVIACMSLPHVILDFPSNVHFITIQEHVGG